MGFPAYHPKGETAKTLVNVSVIMHNLCLYLIYLLISVNRKQLTKTIIRAYIENF